MKEILKTCITHNVLYVALFKCCITHKYLYINYLAAWYLAKIVVSIDITMKL